MEDRTRNRPILSKRNNQPRSKTEPKSFEIIPGLNPLTFVNIMRLKLTCHFKIVAP